MPKFMKGKMSLYLAVGILFVVILGVRFFQNRQSHNGSDLESRKVLVNEVEEGMRIVEETRIQNYIISGITGANGKYGLAIFQPQGDDGYKLQSTYTKEQGEIMIGNVLIGDTDYNLFWFDQSDLDYAEITYTDNAKGETLEPIQLDATTGDILYHEAPGNDYTVKVVYYDVNGNMYE